MLTNIAELTLPARYCSSLGYDSPQPRSFARTNQETDRREEPGEKGTWETALQSYYRDFALLQEVTKAACRAFVAKSPSFTQAP